MRNSDFNAINIEVFYVTNLQPAAESLEVFRRDVLNITQKESVTMLPPKEIPRQAAISKQTWWNISEEFRTRPLFDGRNLTIMAFFLDECLPTEVNASLCQAIGYTTSFYGLIEVFPEAFQIYDPAFRAAYDYVVLLHEFGHLIGLVDNGMRMQRDHENPDISAHSANPESIMWPGMPADGAALWNRTFDADDYADIEACRNATTASCL